ncbi:MAG: hypothetical protein JXQ90_02115 [Cyclobacteriaceae bacterium]
MKKTITKVLSLFMVCQILIVNTSWAFGIPNNEHSLDEDAFEKAFEELDDLEAYVMANEITDVSDIESWKFDVESLNTSNSIASVQAFSMDNMDWASFAWGFFCCPIGFFVVAINKDKSSDQKTSFWIGAVVSSVLGTISGATQASRFTN